MKIGVLEILRTKNATRSQNYAFAILMKAAVLP